MTTACTVVYCMQRVQPRRHTGAVPCASDVLAVLLARHEAVPPAPQCLGIVNCSFPVAAIAALLGLEATEELELDLSLATGLTADALETALTVLCGQARKLRLIRCTNCPLPNCQELQDAVTNKLRSRGKDGIQLQLIGP